MPIRLIVALLLAAMPAASRGEDSPLDAAFIEGTKVLGQAAAATGADRDPGAAEEPKAAEPARSTKAGPAVRKILVAGGRVSDIKAERVAMRLSKLRGETAARRGGETAELLAESDADGDGRVSLPEARSAVAQARLAVDPRAEDARELLSLIDRDANGLADKAEMAAYLDTLGSVRPAVEPLAMHLWKSADTDRNDCLDSSEACMAADLFGKLRLYAGDGLVQIEDATSWMQVVSVIERADIDGSNSLSLPEVAGTTVFRTEFAGIDRDGDGEVTASELYTRASSLAESASRQTCATCPRGKQAGTEKLNLLKSLLTLR